MNKEHKLTRMNLLVDRDHVQRLKELYGVKSESEAIRRACDLALLADEWEEAAQRIRAAGGIDDVFGNLGGNKLPCEWPEGEWEDEVTEDDHDASPPERRR